MSTQIKNSSLGGNLIGSDFPLGKIDSSKKIQNDNIDFKKTLNEIQKSKEEFSGVPAEKLPQQNSLSQTDGIKFSQHALDRMMRRGIYFSPNDIEKLNAAVARASQKGSRDSLVLFDDRAAIVSVKNNTVVTVMDRAALKENVFTNIDSTIVLGD